MHITLIFIYFYHFLYFYYYSILLALCSLFHFGVIHQLDTSYVSLCMKYYSVFWDYCKCDMIYEDGIVHLIILFLFNP